MAGTVIVGLSGGVDSSVAALLLQRQDVPIEALFMQNWEEDSRESGCRAEEDRKDAIAVCGRLGIRCHTRNFAAEYWDNVFAHFVDEYRAGRTPNPDILCNREIKFRTFLEHAQALGAERIATGHYARVLEQAGRWQLLRGMDAGKDQSYFLYTLGQTQLASTLFPLGALPKSEVRRLAAAAQLPTHAKKDSTGICFIGERDFREFLGRYLPAREGDIVDPAGTSLGRHGGAFFYTLGQREGLNLGGVRGRPQAPWFVVGKDVASNRLIVDQGHDSSYLMSQHLRAALPDWVDGRAPAGRFECTAKTRYRQLDQACQVQVLDSGSLRVHFPEPQRAVTPGQSIVFYQGEICLGGAVIEATDAPLEVHAMEAA